MRRTALLACVVMLAACGGGGGDRLGRDSYIEQADAICTKVDEQQKALAAPATLDQIPAYVDKAIPILDTGIAELRALRPPKEMEDGVDRWLKTTDETRDVLEELKQAAEDQDAAAARAAGAKGVKIDERRDAIARELGLTACANT